MLHQPQTAADQRRAEADKARAYALKIGSASQAVRGLERYGIDDFYWTLRSLDQVERGVTIQELEEDLAGMTTDAGRVIYGERLEKARATRAAWLAELDAAKTPERAAA